MNTLKPLFQCFLVITGVFWQSGYANTDEINLWAIGTAWTPDKSDLLYREYHFAEDSDLGSTPFSRTVIKQLKTPDRSSPILVAFKGQVT